MASYFTEITKSIRMALMCRSLMSWCRVSTFMGAHVD